MLILSVLTIFMLQSCDDYDTVVKVEKDTELPNWLAQYNCDTIDLMYVVKAKNKMYLLSQNCQTIEYIPTKQNDTWILLIIVVAAIVAFLFGMVINLDS